MGKVDFKGLENLIVTRLRDDKLSEKEVYVETDFGAYLFNRATWFINQVNEYLYTSCLQGYVDNRIIVSKIKEQD